MVSRPKLTPVTILLIEYNFVISIYLIQCLLDAFINKDLIYHKSHNERPVVSILISNGLRTFYISVVVVCASCSLTGQNYMNSPKEEKYGAYQFPNNTILSILSEGKLVNQRIAHTTKSQNISILVSGLQIGRFISSGWALVNPSYIVRMNAINEYAKCSDTLIIHWRDKGKIISSQVRKNRDSVQVIIR